MKYLNSFRLFESLYRDQAEIELNISDLLRDSILDRDIPLYFGYKRGHIDFVPHEVLSIQLGEEYSPQDFQISLDQMEGELSAVRDYLGSWGFKFSTFSVGGADQGTPQPTITPYLKLFYHRQLPESDPFTTTQVTQVKENLQQGLEEAVQYYFGHLQGDGFTITCSTSNTDSKQYLLGTRKDIRISKNLRPLGHYQAFSYHNCMPFEWSEIADEVYRFCSDFQTSEGGVEIFYVIFERPSDPGTFARRIIFREELLEPDFQAGQILCFYAGLG